MSSAFHLLNDWRYAASGAGADGFLATALPAISGVTTVTNATRKSRLRRAVTVTSANLVVELAQNKIQDSLYSQFRGHQQI
jgi:hypothetical protein